MKLCPIEIPCF